MLDSAVTDGDEEPTPEDAAKNVYDFLWHKKRGKFLSPTETEARHYRDMSWLHTLAHREKMGDKTEAAIAFVAENWNVSRASVFAGIRRAEEYLRSGAKIFAKMPGGDNFRNPRPDKTRNT